MKQKNCHKTEKLELFEPFEIFSNSVIFFWSRYAIAIINFLVEIKLRVAVKAFLCIFNKCLNLLNNQISLLIFTKFLPKCLFHQTYFVLITLALLLGRNFSILLKNTFHFRTVYLIVKII